MRPSIDAAMQEEIANLVHPILSHGLSLRDRLEQGESLNIDIEQATLKGMLLNEFDARRWTEFGGEAPREAPTTAGEEAQGSPYFLGIRYALTCWLDELFILYSRWENAWPERKLEVALYGTNDRAWKFWDQARKAETRPTMDALEVFFLCAMLGFRGELGEAPDKLQNWLATTRIRLDQAKSGNWQPPPALEPITNVPPLRARDRLQRMLLTGGLVLLVIIPVVAFFVVQQLGS